ncbi:MAG: DHH family phosphoesterase [Coriobacteriaceae bacterium]|nr:DHH family phosphoesterase [Coriobacteriaceae bacterium]
MAGFDFADALEKIDQAHSIAICGHINPDGDCIGSQLALTLALRARGKEVASLLAGTSFPDLYSFLEGYDTIVSAGSYDGTPDLFIAVDVPGADRLGDGQAVFSRSPDSVLIDHHLPGETWTQAAYVDTDAAAVSILIWELLCQMDAERSAAIALCCYTALLTDTGSFQFQNADERAFAAAADMVKAGASPAQAAAKIYQERSVAGLRIEALVVDRMKFICDGRAVLSWATQKDFEDLGATMDDGEGLIDVIRQLGGIDVAVMLREQEGFVRGSLRAKGDVDVSVIAKKMNGGGHAAAAGFRIEGTLDEAMDTVEKTLSPYLSDQAQSS